MRITDKQVAFFRQHGYVIAPRFPTPEELAAGPENIARYFPYPGMDMTPYREALGPTSDR